MLHRHTERYTWRWYRGGTWICWDSAQDGTLQDYVSKEANWILERFLLLPLLKLTPLLVTVAVDVGFAFP